ncbi:SDR family oxidoreductase [Halovulum dunhuangense]|uniref:SDR family oxidoreductase n=1 Tax=Halovulum dunhuangense TaxID=1505036 RepID=A0A849L233_9RHOB|nr:SDR family oxidoreductase [Halovulum dunhuangense]NNU80310.1 SDR family oxidoreductase [Halovulum dunhuangense]
MTAPQRILLTGHDGYIGSVMAPHLVALGHEVVGLDTGYYAPCTLVPDRTTIPAIVKDIRDVVPADLKGFDAVIHLAALSNDPIGNLDQGWTTDINHTATVRLAELARDAGVRRFLFSSSCIMYGMSEAGVVDERSPLDPKTEYARSKVKSEMALRDMARDGFSPVYLRNGTVYGVSPRMRFDTVLNNLVGAAATAGVVQVHSDGKPWRPVIHVEDVARAFAHVLSAPEADIHNEAFNNGADHLNHQVIDLACFAVEAVPGAKLQVLNQPGADQRTYKASFAKFARTFPGFEWKWTARAGADELARTFAEIGLTAEQFGGRNFTRLKWLNHLLDTGQLDRKLRWASAEERRIA